MKATAAEIRVLQSLHLAGTMGKCGSMNKAKRLSLLKGLIIKGYLNDKCELTPSGIEVSAPKYN